MFYSDWFGHIRREDLDAVFQKSRASEVRSLAPMWLWRFAEREREFLLLKEQVL